MEQSAVVKGVGRMSYIAPIRILVGLRDLKGGSKQPAPFKFSRHWYVPNIVLHISAGKMDLLQLTFLVASYETECKNIIIGYPVLRHFNIDSRTLLIGWPS